MISSLRVGARLGLGFGILLLLLIVMTAIGLNRMALLDDNLARIVEQDNAKKDTLNAMRDAVRYQAVALRDVVMQEELSFKRAELKLMKEARKKYQSLAAAFEQLPQSAELKQVTAQIKDVEGRVQVAVEQVMDFTLAENHAAASNAVREKLRPPQIELLERLEQAAKQVDAESLESAQAARDAYRSARTLTLILGGLALVIGIGAAWLITQSIIRPLVAAVNHARSIAGGDLSKRLTVAGNDETAQLATALNNMTGQLSRLIEQVKQASTTMTGAAGQMSSEVRQTVQRVDVQNEKVMSMSATLEELTVAISEVASGASGVAEAATEARQIASSSAVVMAQGQQVSHDVVDSVQGSSTTIQELSAAITRITDVAHEIREIADQTNLLALNAAIEAARAGEQGRGFAVVADEVRKLAERTTASTADIAGIVASIGDKTHAAVTAMDDVSNKAREGVQVLDTVQERLDKIVVAADRLAGLAQTIAAATGEQRAAANETAAGMEAIAAMTEENTAAIHGIGTAASQLNATADELTRSVGQFRL